MSVNNSRYQETKDILLLIDTSALIHRAYHAYPSSLTTKEGIHTNAVFGFSNLLLETLRKFHPEYVVCCLDSSAPTERKLAYEQYKAHRKPMEPELKEQLPLVREVITAFNIPMLELPGQEADDLIGTVANLPEVEKLQKILVTGDQDLLQLVDDSRKIAVYLAGTSYSTGQLYDSGAVKAKYGFSPIQMIDYKALVGDSSDNIPGVMGIGKQGGTALIQEFKSVEGIYQSLGMGIEKADVPATATTSVSQTTPAKVWQTSPWKRYLQKLSDGVESARLSKSLATINTRAEIPFSLQTARTREFSEVEVINLFKRLEFRSLLGKLTNIGLTELPTLSKLNAETGTVSTETEESEPGNQSENSFVEESELESEQKTDYSLVTEAKAAMTLLARLAKAEVLSFDTEADSLKQESAKIVGLGVSDQASKGWFLTAEVMAVPEVFRALTDIFTAPVAKRPILVAHNLKYDLHVLANFGIEVTDTAGYLDTLIALYLLSGGERVESLGLKDLARKYLGMQMVTLADLHVAAADDNPEVIPTEVEAVDKSSSQQGSLFDLPIAANSKANPSKGKKKLQFDINQIPLEKLAEYCCRDADATLRLYYYFLPKLKLDQALWRLLQTVEMPLVAVLLKMESNGIWLDREVLENLGTEARRLLTEIEQKIITEVGHPFNLASPKQVGEVLFSELKLQQAANIEVGKTKTGTYSTDERTLQNFARLYPIVEDILKYRELAKLVSTYIEGFLAILGTGKKSLIHTNFRQTVASTGRLASSEPNLQNIPISDEFGSKIRKGFTAGEKRKLLAFDYAQQELRLLAHLSGEEKLKEAFAKGEDIHALTASEILGVKLAEVTSEQRRIGKTVNFGVIYGISAFGLADRLKIAQKEAQSFINSFFLRYPKVREYFNGIKQQALTEERVYTIMGRFRDASGLKSGNARMRSAIERELINFPLQGSAADIMKLAMIKVFSKLRSGEIPASDKLELHLQIHDELIFSYPADLEQASLRKLAKTICEEMSNAYELTVPLLVDVEIGDNWYELQKMKLD